MLGLFCCCGWLYTCESETIKVTVIILVRICGFAISGGIIIIIIMTLRLSISSPAATTVAKCLQLFSFLVGRIIMRWMSVADYPRPITILYDTTVTAEQQKKDKNPTPPPQNYVYPHRTLLLSRFLVIFLPCYCVLCRTTDAAADTIATVAPVRTDCRIWSII